MVERLAAPRVPRATSVMLPTGRRPREEPTVNDFAGPTDVSETLAVRHNAATPGRSANRSSESEEGVQENTETDYFVTTDSGQGW